MDYLRADDGAWIEGSGYRKKILLDAEQLQCPGTLVQLVEIPPHTRVALHVHRKATEVFHFIAGSGILTVGGQTFAVQPGDTLTTQPGEWHDARNDGDIALHYVVFKTNWHPDDSTWE